MVSLSSTIKKYCLDAMQSAYPGKINEKDVIVAICSSHKLGHFQLNSSLKLSKVLKQPPKEIATSIINNINKIPGATKVFSNIEVAGPGFINMSINKQFIIERAAKCFASPTLGASTDKKQKVLIDFSSPNIAKEMHIGHLRSTIIGDSIARLLEFLGHEVIRINHLGDWGTQFGMLIAYITEYQQREFSENLNLSTLVTWYKKAKVKFDENNEFKLLSQKAVVDLQSGKAYAVDIWKKLCEISTVAYKEIYRLLDIDIIDKGESFYNPYLPQIVSDAQDKKVAVESDGAICIFLDGFTNREGNQLPLIIKKADGGFNYATTDLAALKYRAQEVKADRIIYVTDSGQTQHFSMVFKAAAEMKIINTDITQVEHCPFGLVLKEDGKKFKTRSGDTERLIDVLKIAINKAYNIISDKNANIEHPEKAAEILGINAIKYADLSCHRISDYKFSYDKMLSFEGNTAAFIMYAYVRINSIFEKTNTLLKDVTNFNEVTITCETEEILILHLIAFTDCLASFEKDLLPHRLTEYLFNLAENFHTFFHNCKVQGSEHQQSRLIICAYTSKVLEQGMQLLGLHTLHRM